MSAIASESSHTSSAETVAQAADVALPSLNHVALLLDIDGTLLEMAPTPDAVIVPPTLPGTLHGLHTRLSGALALVSGRSLPDMDRIFAPLRLPAVGGHGAEMRLSGGDEAVAAHAPPMDASLKARFIAIADRDPLILVEDKGYSVALHFRLVPHLEEDIYKAVSVVRASLPDAPLEILPGKAVCEIKNAGVTKATGVRELMKHPPFNGRRPIFIGDDVTDESVFAMMPDFAGLSFSVGRHARGVDGIFGAPSDVRTWLGRLLAGSGTAGVPRSR